VKQHSLHQLRADHSFFYASSSTDMASSANGSKAKYDVIVIGGGHNGLTHAASLARAGKKEMML